MTRFCASLFRGASRWLLRGVIATLIINVAVAPARADIIGTGQAMALAEQAQRADALARVDGLLQRHDVHSRLEALGVDPDQARERVAALTDTELAALEARLEELPAGGSLLGVLGGLLVVLIVLEFLGVTNVFTSF